MNLGHKICALTLIGIFLILPNIGHGMDIRVDYINPDLGHDHPYPTLVLAGEIVPGDYDRLLEYATRNNVDLHILPITLATPGGDIAEALKIGQLLKSIYATVVVGPKTGPCASACFILFASAVNRSAIPGLVGIHRPYLSKERFQALSPPQAEKLETGALLAAEDYLHKLRVPSALVDTMFENASSEIHWLTAEELRALGARPAWYEEFLIARCNLDKDAETEFLDHPDNTALLNKLVAVSNCGHQLTDQEATSNLAAATRRYEKTASADELQQVKRANSSHEATFSALNAEVPNWRTINNSKPFLAWLDDGGEEGSNGVSTRDILRQAYDMNQRALVVAIFKEYLAQHPEPTSAPAQSQVPPAVLVSADRWVGFADISYTSEGITAHSTWDIDRNSLRETGSRFSADVRLTMTMDGGAPQLRHMLSITHWTVDCSARTYMDHGGTVAYLDNGKWVPNPYEGTTAPMTASASNPRATELINGICAAVFGQ
jgi:hypothetical protein